MLKPVLKTRLILVMLVITNLFFSEAFAFTPGKDKRKKHYYQNGNWYERSWLGKKVPVSALAVGALVDDLPPEYSIVTVEGIPYYYDQRYYYRLIPQGGYMVVPDPQPAQPLPFESTVNIPNSRGGYTPVTLRKSGDGYLGPQGEYYPEYPSLKKLKTMYGN